MAKNLAISFFGFIEFAHFMKQIFTDFNYFFTNVKSTFIKKSFSKFYYVSYVFFSLYKKRFDFTKNFQHCKHRRLPFVNGVFSWREIHIIEIAFFGIKIASKSIFQVCKDIFSSAKNTSSTAVETSFVFAYGKCCVCINYSGKIGQLFNRILHKSLRSQEGPSLYNMGEI